MDAVALIRRWRPTARVLGATPAGRSAGLGPRLLADVDTVADTPPPWPLRLTVAAATPASEEAAARVRALLLAAEFPGAAGRTPDAGSVRGPMALEITRPRRREVLDGSHAVVLVVDHPAYAAMDADPQGEEARMFRRIAGRAKDVAGRRGTAVAVVSRSGEGWFHPGNLSSWCAATFRSLLGPAWPASTVLPMDLGPHGSGGSACVRLVSERWGEPELPAEVTAERLRAAFSSLRLELLDEAFHQGWPDPTVAPARRPADPPALELPGPGDRPWASAKTLWHRLRVHTCTGPAADAAWGMAGTRRTQDTDRMERRR
ncbi:hypothetical protein [Streptomyces sp. 8N706]|uniref:hypothetical protein n=1 Tax=Streptomyces sp. 8N706 TaxID=3457416 RepID=UPI003FD4E953